MKGQMTDAEAEDYSARLFDAVLDLVIGFNGEPGAAGGLVDPDIIRAALIDVSATVDFNCGFGRVPSERRATGEALGKRYAALLKSLIEAPSLNDGEWPKAVKVDPHGGH